MRSSRDLRRPAERPRNGNPARDEGAEPLPALDVIRELIVGGARGREEHDVAGTRDRARARNGALQGLHDLHVLELGRDQRRRLADGEDGPGIRQARRERRRQARAEVAHFVKAAEEEPIGVQIGIVPDTLPHTGFQIFRQPDLAATLRKLVESGDEVRQIEGCPSGTLGFIFGELGRGELGDGSPARRGQLVEALAGAQREMLRDPKYRAPYFWAGFRLSGSGDLR